MSVLILKKTGEVVVETQTKHSLSAGGVIKTKGVA